MCFLLFLNLSPPFSSVVRLVLSLCPEKKKLFSFSFPFFVCASVFEPDSIRASICSKCARGDFFTLTLLASSRKS